LNSFAEKYDFCTIFDYAYFAKGLALYHSLSKVCDFHLYIFSPDEKCIFAINQKNFPNVTVIPFKEIETQELLKAKVTRTVGEYYWTIKATCIKHLFNNIKLNFVTYIDADSFFFSSPKPFFEELGDKSVLIVPHNFSPQYYKEIKNGKYNAGFISFRNDKLGLIALDWWNAKCIEWCYSKKEDGKFGDQMYLNELAKFEGVYTLKHLGALANWNVQQYEIKKINDSIIGETGSKNEFEVIFYHFHYLKFLTTYEVELGRKYLSKKVFSLFYKPYIELLLELAPLEAQGASTKNFSWKTPIIFLKRKIEGTYNIFSLSVFRNFSS
jgi:hypothetical protein